MNCPVLKIQFLWKNVSNFGQSPPAEVQYWHFSFEQSSCWKLSYIYWNIMWCHSKYFSIYIK